jgi:hypothetical protein
MRRECLITVRLAGPCACCRQAAWRAHVWPDGRILCGNCCPCAARDAATKPAQSAKPGRRIEDRRKTGRESAFPRALLHRQGRGGGGRYWTPRTGAVRGRFWPRGSFPAAGAGG